jgi:hypothetical protein
MSSYHHTVLKKALKDAELADVYAHVLAQLRWSHVTVEVLYPHTIAKLRLDGFTVDAPDEKNEHLRYQITISGWV